MAKKIFLYLFLTDLLLLLSLRLLDVQGWEWVTKPLLMPFLLLHVYVGGSWPLSGRTLLLGGLFFSWAGDLLLMVEGGGFFMAGLASFLTAHIFYIALFLKFKKVHKVANWKFLPVLSCAVYGALMVWNLYPFLGSMKVPVILYATVISCMMLTAAHAAEVNKIEARLIVLGALLFVISDSILAVNKFQYPFSSAGFWVMLTYGFAQLLIVIGSLKSVASNSKH